MRRHRGFTLIELLIAVAIVAVVGVMALVGLTEVINQQTLARERTDRWREVQFAMRVVMQDLAQIHPRPTRDELGDSRQPAVLASPNAQFALEFSRGGWSNPAGFPRGTVLRVAYHREGDTLVRFHWPVMDRTMSTPPIRQDLLAGIEDVEIRFLDEGGNWHREWPPLGLTGPSRLVLRPRAVEFAVEIDGFGRVWRLVETGV
jgi:general secretion pathway protein J